MAGICRGFERAQFGLNRSTGMTSNKSECNQVAQNTLTNKRTDGKLNNPERSLTISGVVAGGARNEKMGAPKAPSALRGSPMPESSVLTKLCRDAQMRRKKVCGFTKLWNQPKRPKTSQNDPKRPKTSQNKPKRSKTKQNDPKLPRTTQ